MDGGTLTVHISYLSLPTGLEQVPTDVTVSLEDGAGVLLESEVALDGSGTMTFDVDWSEGPFAVHLHTPESAYPFTVAGLDEDHAMQPVQLFGEDVVGDTVTLSGTAVPRMEDTWLGVHPMIYGAEAHESQNVDTYDLQVPLGESFVLLGQQSGYDHEPDADWVMDQPFYTITLQDVDGSDVGFTEELDLSVTAEPERASVVFEQPVVASVPMVGAWLWVKPKCTGYTTASGWAEHSEPGDEAGMAVVDAVGGRAAGAAWPVRWASVWKSESRAVLRGRWLLRGPRERHLVLLGPVCAHYLQAVGGGPWRSGVGAGGLPGAGAQGDRQAVGTNDEVYLRYSTSSVGFVVLCQYWVRPRSEKPM